MQNDMTMVLREGGACALRFMGRTFHGTWSAGEGSVTIDFSGKSVFFTPEKGILSSKESGYMLCFARDIEICESTTGK